MAAYILIESSQDFCKRCITGGFSTRLYTFELHPPNMIDKVRYSLDKTDKQTRRTERKWMRDILRGWETESDGMGEG